MIAKGVDAAHVAEDALADLVDVVPGVRVAGGDRVTVAPRPAGGDAGVVKVDDLVGVYDVVGRLKHEHARGGRMDAPAVGDQRRGDGVVAGDRFGIRADARSPDLDTAGAHVR